MRDQTARTWVWVAIVVQFLGYVFDGLWHGLLRPGVEPTTVSEMTHHLLTVHLPLYIGAVAVLVTTSVTLVRKMPRAEAGTALPIAWAGSALSTSAEAWHAYSHLQLDTHHAPLAGSLSALGFFVVVVGMAVAGRTRRVDGARHQRRAA